MNATVALKELSRKVKKTWRLLPDGKFRHGLLRGVAAAIEHHGVLSDLNFQTVVDIGANVGQFSLLAWSLWPHARIHAFEPQDGPACVFEALFPRAAPVTLHHCAVGPQSGYVEMNVSGRHDCSSLLPISTTMSQLWPGTEKIGTAQVEVGPLESYLSEGEMLEPALLKIDVQGAELDVLLGCESLLGKFRNIYIELSFVELYTGQPLCHEVVSFLSQRHFRIVSANNLNLDSRGRPLQADFLFEQTS